MRFNWSEFAAIGTHLAARPSTLSTSGDALLRCAVGRFYYAVFCGLRDEFAHEESWGVRLAGQHAAGVHGQLIRELRRHANDDLATIGHHLDNLRRYRNMCDYDAVIPRRAIGPQSVSEVYYRAVNALAGITDAGERAQLPIALDTTTRDTLDTLFQ